MTSDSECVMWEVLFPMVEGYLAVSLFETARFYSERLLSCCCNGISNKLERKYSYDSSLHQLALCYFRMGKLQQTYLMLLDNCSSMTSSPTTSSPELTEKYKYTLDDNKYLFALSCFGLDKIAEAERALLSISLSNISVSKRLLKSSILHLLGKICRRQHRREVAVEYFMHSLKVDPFMWSSITELSELGVNMDLAGFIHSGQKDVPAPVAAKYQSKYNSKLLSMEVVETLSNAVSTNIEYEQSADSDRARFVMSHVTVDTDDATMQLPATRASMSLGLSSLSLRVPFSSPFGGMPSPIHSVDTGGAFARGEL
eukprot:gene29220-38707_t